MSRRLNRVWLLLLCFATGEVWAMGLGDIQLDSALNEPLRAEIQLISATPEELANLIVSIASAETFERYGIDRPLFMGGINFQIVVSGRTDGNVIRVTSDDPVTEPFLTFLVEAAWSRGRLLREYTLLLDPPTFTQPATTQAPPVVSAPTRTTPADSGRIERTPPARSEPARQPEPTPMPARVEPREEPVEAPVDEPMPAPRERMVDEPRAAPIYDDTPVGDLNVLRGDTLWGIANRVRDDNRLTINQMMLAIYEANPQAFDGNINRLSAGAILRIPTADEVFSISRGDALSEVQRQHAAWGGEPGMIVSPPEPSLTLVPPDEDVLTSDSSAAYDDDDLADTTISDREAADLRTFEVRGMLLDHRDGLIVIGDNELAALQAELVALTGEELPPELMSVVPDTGIDDDLGDSDIFVDDAGDVDADPQMDDAVPADSDADQATADTPSDRVAAPVRSRDEPGLVDTFIDAITGIWGLIGGALVLVAGVLVWFARRAAHGDDEESTGMWQALDSDDVDEETRDSTERLRTLSQDDPSAMVVVEEAAAPAIEPATMEMPAIDPEPTPASEPVLEPENDLAPDFVPEEHADAIVPDIADSLADTGTAKSMEDTFSSDTAINLDQSDPVAEADFHMAYGLYDQAADLINGALEVEPERQDLLTKLCEIYFVWGNRDSFVDAATRLKSVSSGEEDSEWDKIVIMGQQIAADHELFADAQIGAATRAVDLSFDAAEGDAGALDLDFAAESDLADADDGTINLGASFEENSPAPGAADSIDFAFDEADVAVTQEMPVPDNEVTQEMPASDELDAVDETTLSVDSPTVEEQLAVTSEMPTIASSDVTEIASLDDLDADATAEIDLDDLGLDLDSLAESGVVDVSDMDETAVSQTLKIEDSLVATGRNPALGEEDADSEATGMHDMSNLDAELAATGEMPTIEEVTGRNQALSELDMVDTDVGVETSLLDATGQTQVLPEDFVVETGTDTNIEKILADEEATMLASLDDDGDSDYAKTEALPKDAFSADALPDDTGLMPGSTDMDLDLDDLTEALRVSAAGDTIDQARDDATVQQPRPNVADTADDESPTAAIAPSEMSADLHDARTMTEVGTKLDLARAYVDMGDPSGARSILEEVLAEGDEAQRQQAQQLLESLPA